MSELVPIRAGAGEVFLIGGGWVPEAAALVYGPLLAAAGDDPSVACVVLDEGDGMEEFARWADALTAVATCRPQPVLVAEGSVLDMTQLGEADALLVCGGLTPAYAHALAPVASELREWLGTRPYGGFSAGAAVASARAVVGGWLSADVPVCPEDSAEDLEPITVVDGLGLVPFAVDVHVAPWGTLPRLIDVVRRGDAPWGVAIDENTLVTVRGDVATVAGRGRVHVVRPSGAGVTIDVLSGGDSFTVSGD